MKFSVVAVGVDGSPASGAALRWAAAQAARRREALLVIHAFDWQAVSPRARAVPGFHDEVRQHAQGVVEAAVTEARNVAAEVRRRAAVTVPAGAGARGGIGSSGEQPASGEIEVRGEVFEGHPCPALLRAAERSSLTVVGSRGAGGFASLLLGSVAQQVAAHANGPVAVVRGRPDGSRRPVVVGVDGNPASERAFGVALREAQSRGTSVLAVRVYQHPRPPEFLRPVPVARFDPSWRREAEERALCADVAAWSEHCPGVPVACEVHEGHPSEVLIELSDTAKLLVVGTRDVATPLAERLGSVSQQLLHYAECPVLLVAGAREEGPPSATAA